MTIEDIPDFKHLFKNNKGVCSVYQIDTEAQEHSLHDEYKTPAEALMVATALSIEANEKPKWPIEGNSLVYCAYMPDGEYIGGDINSTV